MTQEELNELASDCRLAFGHQAGAYNDGVDAMLRAVSIAQAQAAVEPVGKVLEVAADGSFQTGFFEELPVGTLLYTSPPDPGGLLRDALSNLNDIEPVGVVIGFEDDTGHAIVEHACEGPYGPLNEQECIYNSDQLHAFGASERIKAIGECARLIEDEEEDGLPLETLANGIRALLGKEAQS